MEKVPYSKYTRELRLEAVQLVTEGDDALGQGKGGENTRLSGSQRPKTHHRYGLRSVCAMAET